MALNKSSCVAALLCLGSDREAQDDNGVTPRQYAQYFSFQKCIDILAKHDPSKPYLTAIPFEDIFLKSASMDKKKVREGNNNGKSSLCDFPPNGVDSLSAEDEVNQATLLLKAVNLEVSSDGENDVTCADIEFRNNKLGK